MAIYRVGGSLLRSRVCSPSTDSGARVHREGVPLRRAFLGGVGETKESTTLGNNFSPPLLRLGGVLLQRLWRGRGVLHRSPMLHRLCQVMLLAFFCKDAELSVGVVVAGRPDLAQSSLGGGGRWWRAQIRELEKLGRGPGRWAFSSSHSLGLSV